MNIDGLVERLNVPWERMPNADCAAKKINAILAQRKEAATELTRLQSEVEALRVALEPFAMRAFEEPLVDEEGWTDLGIGWSRDRIVDWFGPSDFRRARSALTGAE